MKLLLIDVSAVYWPQWHATANPDGKDAYERTVRKCRELAEGYDRVAICVDAGDSGRSAILDQYKTNREPHPAPAIEQLRRAIEFLGGDGFHVLRGDGFEADDTIATACLWAQGRDDVTEVIIAGSDKDLLQLVWGKTKILSLHSGDTLDRAAVIGKLGVAPEQVPCYLALVGDKADNIPGCPGIGAKRAAELLQKFGTLDEILKANEDGKAGNGKMAESLYEFGGVCQTSRRLTVLRTDSPIDPETIMEEPKRTEPQDPQETEDPPKSEPEEIETTAVEVEGEERKTALVIREPMVFARQLEPTSLLQAWQVAGAAIKSRAFVQYPTRESAYLAVIAGRERGLGAIASLRGHFVFEGHLGMFTYLVVADILKSGKAEFFRPVLEECSDEQAVWETQRREETKVHRFKFTKEMAQRRGLWNRKNYQSQPDTMLRWRCAAELARAVYSDVCGGVYTEADIGDEIARALEAAE